MRLGIQLNGKSADDVVRRLGQARDAGFSLCQINLLQGGITRADLVAIADAIEDQGVRPVAIGCYLNPMRPDEPTPAGVSRADLDMVLQCLDIIGARRVVITSGTHADALAEYHPDNHTQESTDALRSFIGDVVRHTGARNYSLVIEPWRTHVLSSVQRVQQFHARLEPWVASHVRYAIDPVALLHAADYAQLDAFAADVCAKLGSYAGFARLQDCILADEETVAPAPPGAGDLDLAAYVKALMAACAADTPAVACNVKAADYAAARDLFLRINTGWRLV